MIKLSKTQFDRARDYMKTQAQDIDCAMFEYFFENRPLSEVLDILESYQNEDGGFGCLDYDIECPYSCLKHTESACRYIYALDHVPQENRMMKRVIAYIIDNYNEVTGEWNNLTVPAVNEYPHAPWWHHEETEIFIPKDRADLIRHYNPNINSALAGMLVKYAAIVPNEIVEKVKSIVIDKIKSGHEFGQYGMMSDIYFVNTLNDEKAELLELLMGDGKLISLLDENWGTERAYKLCHWIDTPEHPYYERYKAAIQDNFECLLSSQEEDGSWAPNWSYGEPEVANRVRKRLKGVLTFKFLWTMKKFDCIEL